MSSNEVKHRSKLDKRKTGLRLHSAYVIKQHPGTESTLQACQMFNTELEFLPIDWLSTMMQRWVSHLWIISTWWDMRTQHVPLSSSLESVTPEQDVFMKQKRLMSFPFLFLLVLATIMLHILATGLLSHTVHASLNVGGSNYSASVYVFLKVCF